MSWTPPPALPSTSFDTGDPTVVNSAIRLTGTDGTGDTLTKESDFAVTGKFDLIAPNDIGESYGIRLTDRQPGVPVGGTTGNDTVELRVVEGYNGSVQVQFRQVDFTDGPDGSATTLQSFGLGNITAGEQIALTLSHSSSDPNAIVASYDLYDENGVHLDANGSAAGLTRTFTIDGALFSDEDFTQAQIHAGSLATDLSYLATNYGAFSIDPNTGDWNYSLKNNSNAVQDLGPGSTPSVPQDFTVQVADDQGATATTTADFTVNGTNDAPVVDLNGPSNSGINRTFTYTEGDGNVKIAALGTTADIDSTDFNGGSLTAAFTANGAAEDQLTLLTDVHVTVSGDIISVDGAEVGTINATNNGVNGAALEIDFDSTDATPAAITTLLEHIAYSDNSDNPSTAARTVTFTLVDGDGTANNGHDTGTATATINVTAVNDPPVLDYFDLTIAQGGTTVLTTSDFHITDPDSSSFFFNIQNVQGGEFRVFNGTDWVSAPTGGFTDADIAAGKVEFVQDGSSTTPSFTVNASDFTDAGPAINPTVDFTAGVANAAPVVSLPPGTALTNFVTLDDPDLSTTQAAGINDAGVIVGYGDLDSQHQRGWSLVGTTYTTIDDGGAQDTGAHAITDSGLIIGDYSPVRSTPRYGFTDDNGIFTPVQSDSPYPSTNANGINEAGVIVGSDYLHSGARYTAYIYDNGAFTYFNAPGTLNVEWRHLGQRHQQSRPDRRQLQPNASVQSGYQGYLYENSTFTTFADPLAAFGTFAQAINDAGQIVGFYVDSSNVDHGFLYYNGDFTTIDDPLGAQGTVVTGINNLGQVVGYYKDAGGAFHGFEATIPNTTAEDTPLTINGVSVSDADAGSAQIKVTLAVANGTLTLGDETGLDSVSNDHSGTVDLYGSQAAIDAALASGIVYTPNANFSGSDTLSVTADDQGNTGSGGDQFDSKIYDITVAPRPAVYWAATSGTWDTSGNWDQYRSPTSSDIVFIGVDRNGDPVDNAVVDATAAPIAAHSLYLSNAALDATDVTLGGNLAVDNATLALQGADLTIHSVGGSATVSADYGDTSQITATSGSLVFGDIDGDFTVTALTSDPGIRPKRSRCPKLWRRPDDGQHRRRSHRRGRRRPRQQRRKLRLSGGVQWFSLHRQRRRQRLGDGGQLWLCGN